MPDPAPEPDGFPAVEIDCGICHGTGQFYGYDEFRGRIEYPCQDCNGTKKKSNHVAVIDALIKRVVALEAALTYAGIALVERKDGTA